MYPTYQFNDLCNEKKGDSESVGLIWKLITNRAKNQNK